MSGLVGEIRNVRQRYMLVSGLPPQAVLVPSTNYHEIRNELRRAAPDMIGLPRELSEYEAMRPMRLLGCDVFFLRRSSGIMCGGFLASPGIMRGGLEAEGAA